MRKIVAVAIVAEPRLFFAQFYISCFTSAVNGVVMPLFSVVFSNMINVFYGIDNSVMQHGSLKYMGAFLGIGVGSFIVS